MPFDEGVAGHRRASVAVPAHRPQSRPAAADRETRGPRRHRTDPEL